MISLTYSGVLWSLNSLGYFILKLIRRGRLRGTGNRVRAQKSGVKALSEILSLPKRELRLLGIWANFPCVTVMSRAISPRKEPMVVTRRRFLAGSYLRAPTCRL